MVLQRLVSSSTFCQVGLPPPDSLTPQQTVRRLAVDLYQHCYWELGDVELTKAWLEDLAILGQKIPTFDRPVKEEEHSCAEKVDC